MENELTYLFLYQEVLKEGMVLWLGYLLELAFNVVLILSFLHHVMYIPFSRLIDFRST